MIDKMNEKKIMKKIYIYRKVKKNVDNNNF